MKFSTKWFLIAAIVLCLGASIYWKSKKGDGVVSSLADFSELIAVAEWGDGFRFQVLKAGVGSVEAGTTVMPEGTLLKPVLTGGSLFVDGRLSALETQYFELNDELVGLRSMGKGGEGLMILAVLEDRDGKKMATDAVLANESVRDGDIAGVGSYALDPLRFRGAEKMRESGAKGQSGIPDVLIQVKDEEFGWIHGEGLLTLRDGGGNRLVAWFPAWPKRELSDAGSLEFRVLRAGVKEMAGFSLPATVIQGVKMRDRAPARAVELPQTLEGPDYALDLGKVHFQTSGFGYPFVSLESEFHDKMPGDAGRLEAEGLVSFVQTDFYWEFAESSDGNRVPVEWKRLPEMGMQPAFELPLRAGEIVVFEGRVERHFGYPRKVGDCVVIASGEIAGDGVSIQLVPDAQADSMGLKGFEIVADPKVDLVRPALAETVVKGFQGYRVEFEMEMDAGTLSAYRAKLGDFKEWEPVIFLDDGEYSGGVIEMNRTSSGSKIVGDQHFSAAYEWQVRAKAGQKVTVGLVRGIEAEVIRVRVPVPAE
ncbi:hypothetical protein V2O64_06200 [Verrucomicrobiaceae bacterium 227]